MDKKKRNLGWATRKGQSRGTLAEQRAACDWGSPVEWTASAGDMPHSQIDALASPLWQLGGETRMHCNQQKETRTRSICSLGHPQFQSPISIWIPLAAATDWLYWASCKRKFFLELCACRCVSPTASLLAYPTLFLFADGQLLEPPRPLRPLSTPVPFSHHDDGEFLSRLPPKVKHSAVLYSTVLYVGWLGYCTVAGPLSASAAAL